MMRFRLGCAMLAALLAGVCGQAQVAGAPPVAMTPPMGWNSWNHFAEHVTDADVRSAADQMVSTGMRDAGYVYVNVDDTWQGERDASGTLHSNSRFPDMKALGDYIHSKGLKFGIYSSPGAKTCGGFAGSLDHEAQDARLYASWGVDFLKYDLCSFAEQIAVLTKRDGGNPTAGYALMRAAYKKMGDALRATGRPIVYSLCQYGVDEVWKWGPEVGAQMWRTTDDISDSYARMIAIGIEQQDLARFAGPGRWNDPDMLEVGNGKMTAVEYQTHMSLWVLLAAPLLAGNDLSAMTAETKALLLNRDAIAIDQDRLGRQATCLFMHGDLSAWVKPLADGRVAVGLFNNGWTERDLPLTLADAGFTGGAAIHDVWQHKDLGRRTGLYAPHLPGHGSALLILSR